MWLNLKTGFYSVVQKAPCKENELLVRAHCRTAIEKLHELLKNNHHFNGKILDTPEADYAYRMIVPRKVFATFISIAVKDLVHEDFKKTTSWDAMNAWQRELASEIRKT
jgi:hypothetical protein